ncbi:hypothetical protein WN944_025808 [Citrus x changshan-huyou]|uniref:Uncharacterized protein n=1 Tax=Citrus x changshan-huyou TaxID=2935761 RepID=A0AAP0QH11_9ROSI
MSGLFPGLWVMVNQRRKINKQCRKVSLCRRCESPLMVTDRRQPLVTRISDLDPNACAAAPHLLFWGNIPQNIGWGAAALPA